MLSFIPALYARCGICLFAGDFDNWWWDQVPRIRVLRFVDSFDNHDINKDAKERQSYTLHSKPQMREDIVKPGHRDNFNDEN